MSDEWIRASEIGNYVYCSRAWWLQRTRALASQNVREVKAGTKFHQQHGRLVTQAIWTRWLAFTLLFAVIAFMTYRILVGI
jgi:hypothetical protein